MIGIGIGVGFSAKPRRAPAPTLGLLHDFDPGVSVTLVSGVASSWKSRVSAAAIVQATAGSRPTFTASNAAFRAFPTLDTDGVDDWMTAAFALPVPCLIVLASKWNNAGTTGTILDGFSSNRARIQRTAATTVQFGTAFFFSGTVATPQSAHCYTLDIEVASATARLDGAQIATSAGSPAALAGLSIGSVGTGGDFAACSIARALVYDPTAVGFDKTVPELFIKSTYGTP